MAAVTLIDKYDTVLKALYDISGKRPTFGRILALLRVRKETIQWAEVWDILIKLEKEQFIHPGITDRTSKIPTEVIHLITIDGKIFHEKGGLKGKIEREKPAWHVNHPILYALISAIGGAIISIAVGLLLWQVDKQSKNQDIQETKQTIQDATRRLDSLISAQKNTAPLKKDSSNNPIGN